MKTVKKIIAGILADFALALLLFGVCVTGAIFIASIGFFFAWIGFAASFVCVFFLLCLYAMLKISDLDKPRKKVRNPRWLPYCADPYWLPATATDEEYQAALNFPQDQLPTA